MNNNYIYCPNCGKKILKSDNFCPYCRTPLSQFNQNTKNINSSYNRFIPNYSNQNKYGYTRANQSPQGSSVITRKRITPPKRNFVQAVKLFWVNYVNINGYSTRAEFWWWFLCEYIVSLIFSILYMSTIISSLETTFDNGGMTAGINTGNSSILNSLGGYSIIYLIWGLAIIIPNITLRVRRFRDAGITTGWTITILIIDYLSWIIPFIGWLAWFIARIATIVIECSPSVRKVISSNNSQSRQLYNR